MPNYCEYKIKVMGTKKNCQKWYEKMTNYEEYNHFWRMFNPVEIVEQGGDDENYFMVFAGECAWSLESCCRTSGYSGGRDLFAINTFDLDCWMEAYSREPGMQFQEHYVYYYGCCVCDECVHWEEIYFDKDVYKTFEDLKRDCPELDGVTESDFDDEGYYYKGGFPEWKFHIEKGKRVCGRDDCEGCIWQHTVFENCLTEASREYKMSEDKEEER